MKIYKDKIGYAVTLLKHPSYFIFSIGNDRMLYFKPSRNALIVETYGLLDSNTNWGYSHNKPHLTNKVN